MGREGEGVSGGKGERRVRELKRRAVRVVRGVVIRRVNGNGGEFEAHVQLDYVPFR